MGRYWPQVALRPGEEVVLDALRTIERIAYLGELSTTRARIQSDFAIKKFGAENPLPLGTLGDGVSRILVLILAALTCKEGYLLVDEIDTGFHYSVMKDMWTVLFSIATKLNIQVFATTHSLDCIRALKSICNHDPENPVFIHRIKPTREESVVYDEDEIEVAVDDAIEVR